MNILILVEPSRIDNYSFLNSDSFKNEYSLLWFENELNRSYSIDKFEFKFKKEYFWSNYRTPKAIIETINPKKIIFFEMIDLKQIALMVYANSLGIETIFIEHGAAGNSATTLKRWKTDYSIWWKLKYNFKKLKDIVPVLKSRIFYFSVVFQIKNIISLFKYISLPIKTLFYKSNMMALHHTIFYERTPKKAIVFNEVNFNQIQLYTGINKIQAKLTGVPFFDSYFRSNIIEKNYIVFIDHPYFEENILNWTKEFHQNVANILNEISIKINKKIYIKLHPRSNRKLWESYHLNQNLIEIIQEGDFTDLYLESQLILGYSSSLLNGFICAKKNVVNLGWHPSPMIFGVDFSKTGLCHKSIDINDLKYKIDFWINNNLAIQNEDKYQKFFKKFNSPFDGKASQRIINIINEYT